MAMTKEAHEAMLKYRREWQKKNRDKTRSYTERYWARKARKASENEKETE